MSKFTIDAEVLDTVNKDVILDLLCITENRYLVDTQNRYLRNINAGQRISYTISWALSVLGMEEGSAKDGRILLIIDDN